MFKLGARLFSGFYDMYKELNSANLTGAIDVIVVEQPDGTLKSTPFYVRFGKMGVLRSREKMVDVTINDCNIDLPLKLDDSGEAYFVFTDTNNADGSETTTNEAVSKGLNEKIETYWPNLDYPNEKNCLIFRRSFSFNSINDFDFVQAPEDIYKQSSKLSNNRTSNNTTKKKSMKSKRHIFNNHTNKNPKLKKKNAKNVRKFSLAHDHKNMNGIKINEIFKNLEIDPKSTENDGEKLVARNPKIMSRDPQMVSRDRASDAKQNEGPVSKNLKTVASTSEDTTTFKMSLDLDENEIDNFDYEDINLCNGNDNSAKRTSKHCLSKLKSIYYSTDGSGPEEEEQETFSSASSSPPSSAGSTCNENDLINDSDKMCNFNFPLKRYAIDNVANDSRRGERFKSLSAMKSVNRSADDGTIYSCSFPMAEPINPPYRAKLDKDDNINGFLERLSTLKISLCGTPHSKMIEERRFDDMELTLRNLINDPAVIFSRNLVIKLEDGKYYNYILAIPLLISILVFKTPLNDETLKKLRSRSKLNVTTTTNCCSKPNSSSGDSPIMSPNSLASSISWLWWRRAGSVGPSLEKKQTTDKVKCNGQAICALLEHANKNLLIADPELYRASSAVMMSETGADKIIPSCEFHPVHSQPEVRQMLRFKKTLFLSSDILRSFNLKHNEPNKAIFSVTTKYQGTCTCECDIYFWKWDDKIVISDIDGTITRSDVLGHLMPIVGKQWEHPNVVSLYRSIADNGYKIMYLSARAIGQSRWTKDYLNSVNQDGISLPDGPLQLSPTSLLSALHREIVEKKPEIFKTKCLLDIRSTFPPNVNPFYAGFGNRPNDEIAYEASGVPINKIFTVNPAGEVCFLDKRMQSSYQHISEIMDHIFPPLYYKFLDKRRKSIFTAPDEYSNFTFWRNKPSDVTLNEELLRKLSPSSSPKKDAKKRSESINSSPKKSTHS